MIVVKLRKLMRGMVGVAYSQQNWMKIHKFFRAKKPHNPKEVIECECIYVVWMYIQSLIKTIIIEYNSRQLDLLGALATIMTIYMTFGSEMLSIFANTTVSLQRQESFKNDIRLVINLLESVYGLLANVRTEESEGKPIQFVLRWHLPSNPLLLDIIVIQRKLRLLKANLKYFYKILNHTAQNIDDVIKDISSGLYKNRRIINNWLEIYNKMQNIGPKLKADEAKLANMSKEMYPKPDLKERETAGEKPREEPSQNDESMHTEGPNHPFKDCMEESLEGKGSYLDGFIQEAFDGAVAFDVRLELIERREEDPWFKKTEKYFEAMLRDGVTMADEMEAISKIGDRDVVESPNETDLISITKKKDYILKRAELLDKDSELKPSQLAIKNKIREMM
jgi:hypothetical protein